jgi:hypothetical protein
MANRQFARAKTVFNFWGRHLFSDRFELIGQSASVRAALCLQIISWLG